MISANEHLEVVDNYLAAEIAHSCVAGPFEKLATPGAHISRFGSMDCVLFVSICVQSIMFVIGKCSH